MPFYIACAIAHTVLLFWGLRLLRQHPSWIIACILAPVATAIYDNVVIALGVSIGAGELLRGLNWPRFIAHALLVPLWGVAAFGLARQAGLRWASLPLVWWAFFGYTVVLVAVGLYQEALLFEPIAVAKDGVLSYQNGSRVTPPLAGAFTTVLLLLVCLPIGLKLRSFWLPAAMLFTLLAAGGLTRLLGSAAINLAEVVLALALLLTALRAQGGLFAPALVSLRHVAK